MSIQKGFKSLPTWAQWAIGIIAFLIGYNFLTGIFGKAKTWFQSIKDMKDQKNYDSGNKTGMVKDEKTGQQYEVTINVKDRAKAICSAFHPWGGFAPWTNQQTAFDLIQSIPDTLLNEVSAAYAAIEVMFNPYNLYEDASKFLSDAQWDQIRPKFDKYIAH